MNDNRFKEKFGKWKPLIIQGLVLCICFGSGYMAGRGEESVLRRDLNQSNYNKKQAINTSTKAKEHSPTTQTNCSIKGNISSTGKKTYHLPGGAFYKRTTAEQCFDTEQDAISAGFVKSSR